MAKKHKALTAAGSRLEDWKKESKTKEAKSSMPEVGKVQLLLEDVLFGKDKWGNAAYNFDTIIQTGPDKGRKYQHSLAMEATSEDGSKTKEQLAEWSTWAMDAMFDNLTKIGVKDPTDRDEVEGLSGSIIEASFWKGKSGKWVDPIKGPKMWPKLFFNSMITPAGEEVTEPESADDGDDEYEYEEE